MDNKNEFRLKAKNIRKELDITNISHILCQKIQQLEEYKKANNILLFYPLKNEISLLELINDEKNFYLPRVNGEDLDICSYKKGDSLQESPLGILEPMTKSHSPELIDLIILPALAADKSRNRLGYGKGYYDRLLEKTNAITILPLPKELIFEKLPVEKHDKAVDILITC